MRSFALLSGLILVAALPGCSKPLQANIQLRKENAELRAEVAEYRALRKADPKGPTTIPTNSIDLARLPTATDLAIGRLTGVEDKTLKVYVVPLDQQGDTVKFAGGFQIQAFDHARGANALLGEWTFTPEQARSAWTGKALLYEYVLDCPLSETPAHDVTLRIVFKDLLTGRTLEKEAVAKLR